MPAFEIAYRYLRAKKSHRAVNVITLIAIVGVAVATMAMVLILSIFNGFTDLALSQTSSFDPELSVQPVEGKVIVDADSLAARLSSVNGVAAAMPVLSEKALLSSGSLRTPVEIKGVPEGYEAFSPIGDIMIAGQYARYTASRVPAVQICVGTANLVDRYPSAESIVQLIVPRRKGRINPANPSAAFRSEDFAFSGVFRANNSDVDNNNVIVPLEEARYLLDYDTEASAIEIYSKPGTSLKQLQKDVSALLGHRYKVLTRIEQRGESFRMISIEKWITFMMLIFILVIALFNVISTISLLAIEKRDNMTTLRALGAPASMTDRIFVAEGFLVTAFGGAIGIVLGILLALAQQFFHIVKLSADAATLTIDHYPIRVEFTDILIIAGVIIALSVVVSSITGLINKRKR